MRQFRKCYVFLRLRFMQSLAHRGAIFLEMVYSFLPFLSLIILFNSLWSYSHAPRSESNPFLSYYFFSFLVMIITESHLSEHLSSLIQEGKFSATLASPVSLPPRLFIGDLAEKITRLTYSLPILVIYLTLGDVSLGAFWSVKTILPLVISLILGSFLVFLYSYSLGLLTFWLFETYAFSLVEKAVYILFSGMFLPLSLFPHFLANIIEILPYKYFLGFQVMIWQNSLTLNQIIQGVLMQLFWLVVFVFLTLFLNKRGIRYVSIHGD